jgi:hypothetical protein
MFTVKLLNYTKHFILNTFYQTAVITLVFVVILFIKKKK